ncbi:hypothetical protein HNR29_006805 [Rhizobium leguminosarum]|nr:hypothetical protein [Rhizobium leguminosarum]
MDELAVDPEGSAGVGKIMALRKPAPTGERAMRSSRRVSAMPASNAGRIRAVMLIFVTL